MTGVDLHAFFDVLVPKGLCTPTHADHLRAVWTAVKARFPDISLPCCYLAQDDAVALAWTTPTRHVCIDVYPDGDCDWFARDRDTGRLLSRVGGIEMLQDEKLTARFEQLVKATPAP
jgi:hypothetical protein